MDKVQGVWERCKEKFSNRVAVLERLPQTFKDTLADELRLHAQEAHKLAGSLGVWLSRLTAGSGNRADVSS